MADEQLHLSFDATDAVAEPSLQAPSAMDSLVLESKEMEGGYEALDYQLASLMLQLCTEKDEAQRSLLRQAVLRLSQRTREGQIALRCNARQMAVLPALNVVGEPGDDLPLILDDGYLYLQRYWRYQTLLAEQINLRLSRDSFDKPTDKFRGKSKDKPSDKRYKNINNDDADGTDRDARDSLPDQEHRVWLREQLEVYFDEDNRKAEKRAANPEPNWQQVAAALALIHPFVVLSGGPGTGKTTTITRVLALLIDQANYQAKKKPTGELPHRLNIVLAAPTGKAAIRMLEAIKEAQLKLHLPDEVKAQMPREALTIHKLLGVIPDSHRFRHDENNPLVADIVLIDEASMIDLALMSKLIAAIPAHARLILIGDRDQLASVETGSVFADICGQSATQNRYSKAIRRYLSEVLDHSFADNNEAEKVQDDDASQVLHDHIITLKKNWRFSEHSGISQLAVACNRADSTRLIEVLTDDAFPDCRLTAPELLNDNDLVGAWQDYFDLLELPDATPQQLFAAFNRHRILCALRKGWLGAATLNQRVEYHLARQAKINRSSVRQSEWYHGRPIMITRNSYSSGLFNGDTGIALRDSQGKIQVWFQSDKGEYFSLSPVRLPDHETAWTMTIHKSQGSEFDHVTLILPQDTLPILKRQLIYTGITRARKQLNLVATAAVLGSGVKADMAQATRIADKIG